MSNLATVEIRATWTFTYEELINLGESSVQKCRTTVEIRTWYQQFTVQILTYLCGVCTKCMEWTRDGFSVRIYDLPCSIMYLDEISCWSLFWNVSFEINRCSICKIQSALVHRGQTELSVHKIWISEVKLAHVIKYHGHSPQLLGFWRKKIQFCKCITK